MRKDFLGNYNGVGYRGGQTAISAIRLFSSTFYYAPVRKLNDTRKSQSFLLFGILAKKLMGFDVY